MVTFNTPTDIPNLGPGAWDLVCHKQGQTPKARWEMKEAYLHETKPILALGCCGREGRRCFSLSRPSFSSRLSWWGWKVKTGMGKLVIICKMVIFIVRPYSRSFFFFFFHFIEWDRQREIKRERQTWVVNRGALFRLYWRWNTSGLSEACLCAPSGM